MIAGWHSVRMPAPGAPRPEGRPPVVAAALAGLLVAGFLYAWQGRSSGTCCGGVYALTVRELLDGRDLYAQVVDTQPPPLFLLAPLAIEDSVWSLRAALGLLSLLTAVLVALCTWPLRGRRWANPPFAGPSGWPQSAGPCGRGFDRERGSGIGDGPDGDQRGPEGQARRAQRLAFRRRQLRRDGPWALLLRRRVGMEEATAS